jgi:glucokinase
MGGTHIKAVAVTPAGETLLRDSIETRDGAVASWQQAIPELVARMRCGLDGTPLSIGIATPGLAAPDNSRIAWMEGRLAGLAGFVWGDLFPEFGRVPVLNDAHAALLGEAWLGAARGVRNAILLTLGTGVGGAIVFNGELFGGTLQRAGHLGHMSLNPNGAPNHCRTPGSLEEAIGNYNVGIRSHGRFQSTRELVEAYRAGDAFAASVWLQSVKYLAAAISSLINIVDPQVVVIGGGIAKAGDALFGPLQAMMDVMEWRPGTAPVPIVAAQLGEYGGAYGAARFGASPRLA